MTTAKSHHSAPRKREIRAAKEGSARDAIGTLRPGHEVFVLSFGQWTAANAHLEKAASLLGNAEVLSMRFVVDRSFLTEPAVAEMVARIRERSDLG